MNLIKNLTKEGTIMKGLGKKITRTIVKNGPEILIGTGIVGFVTTAVMAYKAAPKVNLILEDAEADNPDIRFVDKCMIVAKNMWPTFTVGVLSTASLIGAATINHKRIGALSAALSLSEKALVDFQASTLEKVGPEKLKEIEEDVIEKKLENNECRRVETVIPPENGGVLCYDEGSDRYFYSTKYHIRSAEVSFNEILLHEDECSINEFYDQLGLEDTSIGKFVGWRASDGRFKVDFGARLTDDGKPCLSINYPVRAFEELMW